MRVAAVSYALQSDSDPLQFYRRLSRVCSTAKNRGVDLVVLPELIVLELLAPDLPLDQADIPKRLEDRAEQFVGLLEALASSLEITIIGGSHIENNRNVCAIVSPHGVKRVEKAILTQWEANEWKLTPGSSDPDCPLPGVGVAICYDCEFPELIRPLAVSGAKLLCVPSFTEGRQGHQRVRWSCQARAIENQIYVAHAALIGGFGVEPAPGTVGSSAILTPSCEPFPTTAILAQTSLNRPGMAVADLDFDLITRARSDGDVRNWDDYHRHLHGKQH